MSVSALATKIHKLAAAVADAATFTVPYPNGFAQADLTGTTGGEVLVGENDIWPQDDPGFGFVFGAGDITVTNNTGATIPVGTELLISFGDRTINGSYNLTSPKQLQDKVAGL
ncbi:hypothetical protein PhaeoP66_03210 [Phaeobacter inhibens]|uniref:Uncharacterized protein n=1 Tax=Phaeobacter inhibens TaxID=221822 RepID=A0ABM6RHG0_9RHOB|nr:hypothetical protein [Phaeobacter inhibens]AUQ95952.1 hypothetical protein PhaeoP66_03210 [Phaeobacter inhibens]